MNPAQEHSPDPDSRAIPLHHGQPSKQVQGDCEGQGICNDKWDKEMNPIPLRPMCATCPWMPGSPHADLIPTITTSACSEAIRICHSTGSNNAINRRTGGIIAEPTEDAWQATCDRLGVRNGVSRK